MNDDESEIAGNTVLAERRICASQINLPVSHKVFHHLTQIEAHSRFYAEANVHRYAVEGVGNQCLATVLQRVRSVYKLHVDKPVMVSTFRLLVYDGIEQLVIYCTFLVSMVYINKVGSILGDALVSLNVRDNLIIVVQRFGADVMAAYLYGPNPHIHNEKQYPANEHRTPSSGEEF